MIGKQSQIEKFLIPIKKTATNPDYFLLVREIRAVVIDTLTGMANMDILETMVAPKEKGRGKGFDAYMKYAAEPYMKIKDTFLDNFGMDTIFIIGHPGTGKTHGLKPLLFDSENNRNLGKISIKAKPELGEVPTIHDAIFFNLDGKQVNFAGGEYFYRDKDMTITDVNHHRGMSFTDIVNTIKGQVNFRNADKLAAIPDPFGRTYKNYPIVHLNIFAPDAKLFVLAHLEEQPVYKAGTKRDEEKEIDYIKEFIKVFGNLFNKLDFANLANTILRAEKGVEYTLNHYSDPHSITRAPKDFPSTIPNDFRRIIDELGKLKPNVEDFI